MSMSQLENAPQSDFRRAILSADRPVPDGLVGPTGARAGKRFDVYRNNVAVSLTEALRAAFPVIRKLVGDEFFDAMAGAYLRKHPPSTPLMMYYGAEMPAFLRRFGPVKHLGYLPDIAKVELAVRASYHAPDSTPIQADALQAFPPEQMISLKLTLAPTVRIVQSRWPIFGVWDKNMRDDAPQPQNAAQHVLVTRPGFDPMVDPLTPDQSRFLQGLGAGKSLGLALAAAPEGFDPAPVLGLLLSRNALTKAFQ